MLFCRYLCRNVNIVIGILLLCLLCFNNVFFFVYYHYTYSLIMSKQTFLIPFNCTMYLQINNDNFVPVRLLFVSNHRYFIFFKYLSNFKLHFNVRLCILSRFQRIASPFWQSPDSILLTNDVLYTIVYINSVGTH